MSASGAGEEFSEEEGGSPWGRAFLFLCFIAFLNSFVTSPFSSLFPVYIEADLGRLPLFTGYLKSIILVLGGIFAVVGGRMCDTMGAKKTLLVGLFGSLLCGLVFRWGDPWILTLLVLCIGIASGYWSTAGQSLLIASVDSTRLGIGSAFYFLSNTAGNSLGSLVTGLMKQNWTFPKIGLAMTVGSIGILLLAGLMLPSGVKSCSAVAGRSQPLALWTSHLHLLRVPDVHLLVGLRYSVTTFWGMATLVMPLLVYRISGQESHAAYFAALSLAVAAVGQLLTGFWRDRCGQSGPFVTAALGVVLSALGLALYWQSVHGLFFFGTTLTASAWAVSTLVPGMINDVARPGETNRLVGLGHTVWSAGMVTGSLMGGILLAIDPAAVFFVGAVLSLAGTGCGWRLCQRIASSGNG